MLKKILGQALWLVLVAVISVLIGICIGIGASKAVVRESTIMKETESGKRFLVVPFTGIKEVSNGG